MPRWTEEQEDARQPERGARAALQETRALYRRADEAYAPFGCPASGECCQLATTRRLPYLWLPEWLLILERLRAEGRALPPARDDGGCPFLDEAGRRCTVYPDRPFGCRTFFCQRATGPARQPAEEVIRLSRRLEAASQALEPELTAPRSILEWHRAARVPGTMHLRSLVFSLLLLLPLACVSSNPAVGAALLNTAAAGAASATSRASGGCYAACPSGTTCDTKTGHCVELPCRGRCGPNERCDTTALIPSCVPASGPGSDIQVVPLSPSPDAAK